jgi:hypothetical protein
MLVFIPVVVLLHLGLQALAHLHQLGHLLPLVPYRLFLHLWLHRLQVRQV